MFMRNEITEADHTNNVWNRYNFVSEVMGKRFIHPWRLIKYLKRSLKWSWQRIVRGFSDGDIWWMHDYLQMLLPDMLEYLKDHRMGSPVGLSLTDEPGDDSCHEEWDKILSQMIFCGESHMNTAVPEKIPTRKNMMRYCQSFIKNMKILTRGLRWGKKI